MAGTCTYLRTCPFYKSFGSDKSRSVQAMVKAYCLNGERTSECWRLKYCSRFGDQPSLFITPLGNAFPALSSGIEWLRAGS
ncbi:hypothetical protein PCS_01524 [Desulfocurvibacter africanus PCS]|uniref:Uncharacterized protein n=1 Tax=Desulfocurvibacter africanus PCS TaxID=1262666 RepID=M5Q1H7_DESAF|nr:hypothetical protein PCS_01524 [Desulfocurvibacter africanus PCS]